MKIFNFGDRTADYGLYNISYLSVCGHNTNNKLQAHTKHRL